MVMYTKFVQCEKKLNNKVAKFVQSENKLDNTKTKDKNLIK